MRATVPVIAALAFSTPSLWPGRTAEAGAAAAEKINPSAAVKDPQAPLLWYDARLLTIEGKGWTATEDFYDRLPAKAKGKVTEKVWNLGKNSAGLCARFVTDAPAIFARWTVTSPNLGREHMPATGMSGLDLYVHQNGTWLWAGSGIPAGQTTEAPLAEGIPPGEHEYVLYLPLYNGTKALEIGISPQSTMIKPPPRPGRPICVYGTSIVQGGCASRPGMAHLAILGRKLDTPIINLGFSGSACMEPEMDRLLAELDVAAYVLDCLPNMTTEVVGERLGDFVEQLRRARPRTPIILVEHVMPANAAFLPGRRISVAETNMKLRQVYRSLRERGFQGLSCVSCDNLLGRDGEGTVDGIHPTDLGFQRFADALEPVLRKVAGSISGKDN